jgi:hypothetical protein
MKTLKVEGTCAFVLLLAGAFIIEAFDIGSLSVILPILKPLMHLSAVQVGGAPRTSSKWQVHGRQPLLVEAALS